MTLSSLRAAAHSLAQHLLGPAATAHVTLLNSPVLSAANPALLFRIALSSPHLPVSLSPGLPLSDTDPATARRAIVRACNAHRPWIGLGLGLCSILTVGITPAAEGVSILFDFKAQPVEYHHDDDPER